MEFTLFSQKDLLSRTSKRSGETKIGEKLITFESSFHSCQFIIVGIEEDLGPQANLGLPGANKAFEAFLSRFVNIQSNRFLTGENIGVLGKIFCSNVPDELDEKRNKVSKLDLYVEEILNQYIPKNAIPIVIGGGHNNALPLIRWAKKNRSLTRIINIDPHADFRALEGRHSGNPFSTAFAEKSLHSYAAFGLHENYNSESMLQRLEDSNAWFSFFENYLDNPSKKKEDIDFLCQSNEITGLDFDMDAISFSPSSAFTPSGFTIDEARMLVREFSSKMKFTHFHLPEAAPKTSKEEQISGKMLAYLVSDFIKTQAKHG